jgi:hypothetical protein
MLNNIIIHKMEDYDYDYEYENEDIDVEIDKNIILVKMLSDFNLSEQQIEFFLSRNNFDFDVAIRFFINNYQEPLYAQQLVDYEDMFYDFDEDDFEWSEEMNEKVYDLVFSLINTYNVNLTNLILTIIFNDDHILQEDKQQYMDEILSTYDENNLDDFIEKIKYPFINYIFNIFVEYSQYYREVDDIIERLVENENINRVDNLEYEINETYDSDYE